MRMKYFWEKHEDDNLKFMHIAFRLLSGFPFLRKYMKSISGVLCLDDDDDDHCRCCCLLKLSSHVPLSPCSRGKTTKYTTPAASKVPQLASLIRVRWQWRRSHDDGEMRWWARRKMEWKWNSVGLVRVSRYLRFIRKSLSLFVWHVSKHKLADMKLIAVY